MTVPRHLLTVWNSSYAPVEYAKAVETELDALLFGALLDLAPGGAVIAP